MFISQFLNVLDRGHVGGRRTAAEGRRSRLVVREHGGVAFVHFDGYPTAVPFQGEVPKPQNPDHGDQREEGEDQMAPRPLSVARCLFQAVPRSRPLLDEVAACRVLPGPAPVPGDARDTCEQRRESHYRDGETERRPVPALPGLRIASHPPSNDDSEDEVPTSRPPVPRLLVPAEDRELGQSGAQPERSEQVHRLGDIERDAPSTGVIRVAAEKELAEERQPVASPIERPIPESEGADRPPDVAVGGGVAGRP